MPKEKTLNSGSMANSMRHPNARKKKTKFVKSDSELVLPTASSKVVVWWEAWQENCSTRSLFYDQDIMSFQRLAEATEVFNKNRVWPSSQTQVRNRWDQFQVFAGLLDNAAGDEIPRISRLVHNPSLVVQVYLSSYFIEKGLHLSKYNCDIIPKLLFFYVNFLLVNRILPDKEDNLHRALAIIERAKTELALFALIGQSCPDHINLTCKELFGDLAVMPLKLPSQETGTARETEGKDVASMKISSTKKKKRNGKSKTTKAAVEQRENSASDSLVPVEREEIKETDTGAWGDMSAGSWGADASFSWGDSSATADPWATIDDGDSLVAVPQQSNGWGNFEIGPPASSFVPAHIVKALPITHIRGVVEHSVRRVKAIIPPVDQKSPGVKREDPEGNILDSLELEKELTQSYWTAILEPWPMKLPTSDVPRILSCSNGHVVLPDADSDWQIHVEEGSVSTSYVGNVKLHDCLADEITVFLEEDVSKCLQIGMGLGGTWGQLLRTSDRIENPVKEEGCACETRYWYMVEVLRILPSYFTVFEDSQVVSGSVVGAHAVQ